jgi:hypothetical protein
MIYTVKFTTDKYFSGIPVSQIRESVIEICNNYLSNDDMAKLLFHLTKDEFEDTNTRKIPHIIFSKPKQYSFSLKAFGDEDLELLLKIKKLIEKNNFIKVKKGNSIFNIKDTKLYMHNSMAEKSNKSIIYRTISPIILFKGNRRKIFDAIYNKYKHNTKLMDKEFQNSINKMLIAYMKNLSKTINKKRSYEIYNKIDIEWTSFKIFFGTDREVRTPMIVGEFKTSWKLPHLLGNRIGAGFGHVMEVLPNNLTKRANKHNPLQDGYFKKEQK